MCSVVDRQLGRLTHRQRKPCQQGRFVYRQKMALARQDLSRQYVANVFNKYVNDIASTEIEPRNRIVQRQQATTIAHAESDIYYEIKLPQGLSLLYW